MKIYLIVQKPDGTVVKNLLKDGFLHQSVTGEKLGLVDENGHPVEVPLEKVNNDLIIQLGEGKTAFISDFFANIELTDVPEEVELEDEIEVALSADEDQPDLAAAISAATQPDGSFTLMRFSTISTRSFGRGYSTEGTTINIDGLGGSSSYGGNPVTTPTTTGTNQAPVANPDEGSSAENGSVTIDLTQNDRDPEGGSVSLAAINGSSASVVTLSSGATVTRTSGGVVRYEPGAAYDNLGVGDTAVDTFSYQIVDEAGNQSSSTVSVTVVGENDAPDTNNDSGNISEEDTTPVIGNLFANDSDPEGDNFEVSAVNGSSTSVGNTVSGSYGSITINSDGNYNYSLNNAHADVQALGVGQTAVETFTYTADDGNGGTSTATLSIIINGENDPLVSNPPGGTPNVDPGVYDDNATLSEEDTAPVTGNVLSNDLDPDGDNITVSGVNGSSGLVGSSVSGSYGSIQINSNGEYSYNLNNADSAVQGLAVGETLIETFTYTANDGNGSSASATLTLTIGGENDAPESNPPGGTAGVDPGIYDDSVSLTEEFTGTSTGNVLANDRDPDGDTLTVTAIDGDSGAVGSALSGAYGTVTVDANGDYTYQLNSSDPVVQALGVGQTAVESFTYLADDGNGGSATATLSFTINGENDAPTSNPISGPGIYDDTISVNEEASSISANLLSNDSDPDGDTLTVSAVDGSAGNVGNSIAGTYGNITVNSDGSYTYEPTTANEDVQGLGVGETLIESFTYTAHDGNGGSATATLAVTINGENDAPTSNPGSGPGVYNDIISVDEEDLSVTGNVLSNDSDPDGDTLTVSAVNGVTANVGNSVGGTYGYITVNSNGSYTYNPTTSNAAVQALGVGETLVETFTYTANDGNGGSASAFLNVTINGENDAPTSNPGSGPGIYDDTISVDEEDASVTGNVLSNDSDPDGDTLSVSAVNGVSGNVGNTVTGTYGDITLNLDGSYTYEPTTTNATVQALGVGETLIETFTYTADDSNGGSASATLLVTINGENDAPTSNPGSGPGIYDDTASLDEEDASVSGNVLSNDTDPDGDALTVRAVNGVAGNVGSSVAGTYGNITVNSDGSYTYNPTTANAAVQALGVGETLIETFTYTANDGNGVSASASLLVTINGENDAPTSNPGSGPGIYDDTISVDEEDASVSGNVLSNDSDPDGDTLTVSAVNGVSGNVGNSVTGTYGNITVNSDGSYTYEPTTANATVQALGVGETLIETFTYTGEDGHGGSASASLNVTINGENDAPTSNPGSGPGIYDDTISIDEEDASVSGNVLSNDSDPDGDPLTVSAVNGVSGNVGNSVSGTYGTITVNSDGSYTYNPTTSNAAVQALGDGETLIETFTYTASDGNGGSASASLLVTINGENDAPTSNPGSGPGIYNDTISVGEEDASVSGNVLTNDSDPDGDSLTVSAVNGASGNVGSSVTGTYGDITVNSDGSYTYNPTTANAAVQALGVGETLIETFTYTAHDGNGGSASASLLVTINGENDAPTSNPGSGPGIYDDTISVDEEDASVSGNVLSNDSDPDGDTLTVSAVNGVSANVGNSVTGTYGDITVNPDGSYTYEPATTNAAVQALGVGETLIETFTYTANDGNGGSASASLLVTINGENDAPTSNPGSGPGVYDDTISVNEEDASVSGNVLSNDSDPDGDALTVSAVNDVSGNVGTSVAGTYGNIALNSDGSYTYSPTTANAAVQALGVGETLIETFTYTANDGNGGSASASLLVTINGENDAPTSNPGSGPGIYDDTISVDEEDPSVSGNVLSNDSDPDGDTLTVSAVNGATGNVGNSVTGTYGDITVNSDGSYTYEPTTTNAAVQALGVGETLIETFTYTASDGNGGSASASLLVTINGENDAPTSNPGSGPGVYDDTIALDEEDASVSGNVLSNDSDPDGDTLTVSAVNGASGNVGNSVTGTYGDITVNSDGSYTYNPTTSNAAVQALGDGETLIETFTYTAHDGNGGSASASLLVTINGENDAPTSNPGSGPGIYDDTASVDEEDASVSGNVLTNDSDPDGDTLTVTAVNGVSGNVGGSVSGTYGDITVNSDGSYTYSPTTANAAVQALGGGETLIETFTYTANDGNGGSASASLLVTINGENDAPTANPGSGPGIYDDTISVDEEDTSVSGNVLTNDSDPDGDALTVTAVNGAAGNVGNSVTGTYGDITVNSDGSYTFNPTTANAAVQALGVGETLIETFTYTADDGNGGSATASLLVTINGENDAPTSNPGSGPGIYDDSISLDEEDASVSGNVLANDSDPDGDTLTVSAVNGVSGNVGNSVTGTYGTITIGSDGAYTYNPTTANAAVQGLGVGETLIETFTYTANDGNGGSASASLLVTINGENDAPTSNPGSGPGIYDDTISLDEEDASVSGNVLSNDSDPDGDTLTVTAVNGTSGNVGNSVNGTYGSITLNSDGSYTYNPTTSHAAVQALNDGETLIETFTYIANDGNGGTASASLLVTINGEDEGPGPGPGIFDDTASIDEEDLNVSGNVLGNDSDPEGDTLTVTEVNGASGNVGNSVTGTYGSITVDANGSYTYTPVPANTTIQGLAVGETLIETFTYTADDGNGNTDSATLLVTINGENDAPTSNPGSGPGIYDDTISVDEEDASVSGNVLSNDSDPDGDSLVVSAVNGVSGNVGNSVSGTYGTITVNSDGSYTYSPTTANAAVQALGVGETLIETFTYTANDGNGGSASASLLVTINGENDAPTSNPGSGPGIYDDTVSVDEEDASVSGNVLSNDSDPDGDTLTVSAVNGASGNVGNSVTGTYGDITLNSDGSYTYNPTTANASVQALGVGETLIETFTYTAHDGNGGSASASLLVTINGENDAPTSNPGSGPGIYDDTASVDEEEVSVSGNVLTNDSDPDGDTLTVSAVNGVSGNVGNSVAGTYGDITLNSDGTYTYSPTTANTAVQGLGVGETLIETFTYTANDGNGGSASASLLVTINGENDAPTSNPGSGPGIYDDTVSVDEEDASVSGNVLSNDSDPDGDTLTVSAVNGASGNVGNSVTGTYGDITVNTDGSYTYSPTTANAAVQALGVGETLIETFTYTAVDGNGGSASASLLVTINGENDAPTSNPGSGPGIYDDAISVDEEDASVSGNVLTNDSDPDGDTLTVSAVNGVTGNVGSSVGGAYGNLTVNSDGSYTYSPTTANATVQALGVGETLIETFTYTANDGNGGSASASLLVTINGENDAPTSNPGSGPGIYDDTISVDEEDASVSGNVLSNDSDPDGDTLTVTAVNGGAGNIGNSVAGTYGDITVNSDGSYTYEPTTTNAAVQALGVGETLIETFTYTANDGNGGSASASLLVTINGENDAPTSNPGSGPGIYDDTVSVDEEDASVSGNVLTNDSDPDGDTLTVSAVNGVPGNVGNSVNGTYGDITLNSDGTYTYSPTTANAAVQALGVGETLIETFTYTANDGNGGSASASLLVTINGENDAPTSNPGSGPGIYDDTISVDEEDASVSGNVLSNDSDPDGDTLTVSAVNGTTGNVGNSVTGTYGDITVNSDGSYTYSPTTSNAAVQALGVGETLIETFTYTAHDGNGGSASASLLVTINGENDAPTSNPGSGPGIYDDTISVDEEDASVSGNVLTNDSDPDGDTLTVSAVNGASGNVGNSVSGTYGDITVNSDGSYTYSPTTANASVQALGVGETLIETFTYTAHDGNGGSASASLLVTINGENDAPTSNPGSGPGIYDDTISVDEEDASVSGNVLTNDSDPDGDTLTVSAVNGASGNVGNSVSGTYGDITVNSDGSYTYSPTTANASVQALGVGETLIETFTYTAHDGNGGSASASLLVTINGENDVPTSNPGSGPGIYNDTASVDEEDTSVSANVLSNDSDPDGDTLTVSAVNGDSGNVGNSVSGSYGAITVNSDGSYTYNPTTANATVQALGVGETLIETFTYTAHDGNGGSASASLLITINGENDAPPSNPGSGPGIYDDTITVNEEDASVSNNVLTNDSDPDGDTLTVSAINGVSGNVGNAVAGSYGSITVLSDGSYTYSPTTSNATVQALSVGETLIESFTYTANDGNGGSAAATLLITINGENDAPTSNPGSGPGVYDDTISVGEEDTSVSDNVLSNDSDPDGDTLTVSAVNGVSGNVGNSVAGSYGSITVNSDGTYTYSPTTSHAAVQGLGIGETLIETFTYTASDGNGGSATASLLVTINGENDDPTSNPGSGPGIYDDSISVNEEAVSVSDNVLDNDSDPDGDTLTVSAVNGVSGNVGNSVAGSYGSITVNSDGTYTYNPTTANATVQALGVGETLIETFTYTAHDGNGSSATASLLVTINGENDAPTSNPGSGPGIYDDTASIDEEEASVAGNVLSNDSDPDGDSLTVTAVDGTPGNVGTTLAGTYGEITINADGTYSYELNNSDSAVQALEPGETATDTFIYLADDGNGGSAAASLVITINGELDNEAPVAVDDHHTGYRTQEDSMDADGTFDSLLNLDLELDVLNTSGWQIGSGTPDSLVGADVSLDLLGLLGGVINGLTTSPQGGVFVGLNAGTEESIYTTLTNLTPGQTYTVRLLQANVGLGGLGGTPEGDLVGLRVVLGDETQYTTPSSYDGEGDQTWVEQSLTFTATGTEQRLEIFADDTDGGGGFVAVDAVVVTEADAAVNGYEFAPIDLLENDYDAEGDDFNLTHIDGTAVSQGDTVTLASGNTVTFNYDGTVSFDHSASPLEAGESETFTYTIEDQWGQTDTATVTMEHPNEAPVAVDDRYTGQVTHGNELEADGSFDSLLNLELGLDVLESSGWSSGVGSPDSLVGADVSLDLLGLVGDIVNGLTTSPQGGVFVGLDAGTGESVHTTLNNLVPGQTYTVRLVQANVGVAGLLGSGTQEGDLVGLRVVLGDETHYTTPTPYEGSGDQLWVEQTLTFTATEESPRLEIFAEDTDGSGGYIAIDAVIVTAADAEVAGYDFGPIDLLENDYDDDGHEITLSHIDGTAVSFGDTVTLASGNTVTVNYDGTVTFDDTADPLEVGETETFSYTITDELGATDTATVTMEHPAYAADDTFTTTNGRLEANVLVNDDVSQGELTIVASSLTDQGGTLSIDSEGNFTYIAAPGFTGEDSFTYTVESETGETDTATVTLNVDSPGTPTFGNLNIAFVIDESASIETVNLIGGLFGAPSESQHIKNGLESFVDSMLDTGNKISFIGMSDSNTNTRNDHIIEQEVTSSTMSTFDSWISDYRSGRVGIQSDYWASGFEVAANGLSETPDLVILLTDGAQGDKSLAASYVADLESNGSHVFAIGADSGDYWGNALGTLEDAITDVLSSNPEVALDDLTDIMTNDFVDGGFSYLSDSLDNVGPALTTFFTPTAPPVVIDMDNDGVEFDSVEDGINFDIDGDGVEERVAWADEDDAVLVYDHNQDGNVTERSEIAFADYLEGAETDLEGLRYFDSNEDGYLDENDEEYSKFALWQDSNGDGSVDEGEMMTLLQAGIASINLTSDQNSYEAANGDVTVHGEAEVLYHDGSTGIAADAEFNFEEIIIEDEEEFEVITDNGESLDINTCQAAPDSLCPEGDIVAPPVMSVDDQDLI
ncbi:MAG: Ig-like domain-containing protein [Verrucomicrobiales bacterium]|nr:Ig-like domain-containing protein [Verrucomicrobiales bacterium]